MRVKDFYCSYWIRAIVVCPEGEGEEGDLAADEGGPLFPSEFVESLLDVGRLVHRDDNRPAVPIRR